MTEIKRLNLFALGAEAVTLDVQRIPMKGLSMHFLHMVWMFGHMVGTSHAASIVVINIMVILTFGLIYFFYKVFRGDLFGDQ